MTNKMETNALPHSVIIEHLDAIQHRAEQLNNKGEIKMENKTDNPDVWGLNDYSRSMFDNGEASVEETDILPHSIITKHLDAVKHRVEQLNKTGEI